MNVFVLCTGRTGSVTFTSACRRMTNFTASHERNSRKLFAERMVYPDNHIEVDNRLTWHLGQLAQVWGDSARYVHLTRDADAVASSMNARWGQPGAMVQSYKDGILRLTHERPDLSFAYDMIACQETNTLEFLSHRQHVMTFRLEHWQEDWPTFWKWIGAEGDYEAALNRFKRRRNNTERYKERLEARGRNQGESAGASNQIVRGLKRIGARVLGRS
jgi:hypothetical protein